MQVEQLIAPEAPAYKAAQRRYQRAEAQTAASLPRNFKTMAGFSMDYALILAVRTEPNSPALCWPIMRELHDFLRFARTERGQNFTTYIQRQNAEILIRAELIRLARTKH